MFKEVCAFNTCEYELYCPNCKTKIIKQLSELLEKSEKCHICQECTCKFIIKW